MRKRRRAKAGARPSLSVPEVLAWADAYRRRKGRWPGMASGPVRDAPLGVSWRQVDTALRLGLRGLPRGSSLARLLARERGVRNRSDLPRLSAEQVLAWADGHRGRAGPWPTAASGPVAGAPGETWRGLDTALRLGLRGLPAGSSLARLLARERDVRNVHGLPPLSVAEALAWADAHRARTGSWPTASSGPVAEAPGETWAGVGAALAAGGRGLPGGTTLARLLARRRGARNPRQLPRLAVPHILRWARAHRRRTGRWPTAASGPVAEAPGEAWSAVAAALQGGWRGLPAGLTLAGLRDGRPPRAPRLPRLTERQVLRWADAHRARTGAWPCARGGPVAAAPGETWRGVDDALRCGLRGLRGGRSLAGLLRQRRGLRDRAHAPPLSEARALAWADAHRRRTGAWPSRRSGPVEGAPGETWRGVDDALRCGLRGLRGGRSLAGLLARERGVRNRAGLPRLRPGRIVAWARAHRRRTGQWPNSKSGPVAGAAGETWKGLDVALRWGHRGLAAGTSLARLLALRAGARNRAGLPALSEAGVAAWAEAHRRRVGRWPGAGSGAVAGAAGETWGAVDQALRAGHRGLPGGSSLAELLRRHGGGAGAPTSQA